MIAIDLVSRKNVSVSFKEGLLEIEPVRRTARPEFYLSSGWLDLQVNGFAGFDVNRPDLCEEDIVAITSRLWQEGVTAWCPTLISASTDQIENSLKVIRAACEQDPRLSACIPGIHLEGPYISASEGTHGAHPVEHIRPPSWEEFSRWQAASGGRVRIVTLAPELPGAIEFIRQLAQAGVIPALGHTRASTECVQKAVSAGARLATHLGNGIEAILPRHPNPIWDQLAENRLYASLIFDGFHLPAAVMKVILRAKGPKKCLLVSDASAMARLQPGVYSTPVGGKVELLANGRLSLYGTNYLAGSASSIKDGLENALRLAGCRVPQAIQLASVTPAQLLGWKQESRTLFHVDPKTRRVTILAAIVDDRIVYQRPGDPIIEIT